jgi:pimeloyl-ACP methyl ester carboxylesterase
MEPRPGNGTYGKGQRRAQVNGDGWMIRRSVTSGVGSQTVTTLRECAAIAGLTLKLPAVMRCCREPVLIPMSQGQLASDAADVLAVPVLLIHGYLGTEACWTGLLPHLRLAGFHSVFAFRYNSLTMGVSELAADLVRAASSVMEQTRFGRIHLVGHSLGGLVARYAVQRLGLDAVALGVVTIATPHQGSMLARVAPGRVGAQMRPGSSLLAELPPLSASPSVSWAVIDSDNDMVLPYVRAGNSETPGSVLLHGHGHQTILRSHELADAIVKHLRASETTQGLPDPASSPALCSVA